jgi:hypothetical protein
MQGSPYLQKGWIITTGGWKSIVNNGPVQIQLRNKLDITKAFARAAAVAPDKINERTRIWWQIATRAPLSNEVDAALQALKLINESKQTLIGADLLAMTQGHVLYQMGELDAALASYKQIPKSSSLWLDSVEERAWTHLRQSDYDKSLGVVTTALSPVLAPLAGPETYFLANLLAYRVCDYSKVFNNSEAFKLRHRNRLGEIQDLAQKGTNHSINEVLNRFDTNGVNVESASSLIESVPRALVRDQQFVRSMESRRALLSESALAAQLSEHDKSTVPALEVERSIVPVRKQADQLKQVALQRARTLAQTDLKDYRTIINKMHIIEAEVIQRLHMDDNLKGERSKLSKSNDPSDALVFPYSKEVWMDELDNYQARVKDCPTLKGASL